MKGIAPLAALLVLGAMGGGCKKPPPDDANELTEAPPPTPAAVPVDHVQPGSLAPGKEKAFALVLPLGFPHPITVDSTAASEGLVGSTEVVTYISERVRDGKRIEIKTEDRTVFEGVRVPDEPDRYLRIVVTAKGETATLIAVTDVTPPKALPPVSEAERYKQVGMDPRGHLLRPNTIE